MTFFRRNKLTWQKRNYKTCPICFQEFKIADVPYFCPTCEKPSPRDKNERNEVRCKNPECKDYPNGIATIRRCPKCKQIIPRGLLETDVLPFSIIGVAASGKTNYITVMLEELMNNSMELVSLYSPDTNTYNTHLKDKSMIYDRHFLPPSTSEETPPPQIWCIRNMLRRNNDRTKTYSFTIYDGAGEQQEKISQESPIYNYIKNSRAIILAIDPLALTKVRHGNLVAEEVMRNSLGGAEYETDKRDDYALVNNVFSYIKSIRGIREDRKLDLPVAVVFTKFDTVIGHEAFDNSLIRKGGIVASQKKVDEQDLQYMSDELKRIDLDIRNWLRVIKESAFLSALEANCMDYALFGVSSFGSAPPSNGVVPDIINPHRVLDPLFWLFKRADFID